MSNDSPWSLLWREVDPKHTAFDATGQIRHDLKNVLDRTAGSLEVINMNDREQVAMRRRVESQLDQTLVTHLGSWVSGWKFGAERSGVTSWDTDGDLYPSGYDASVTTSVVNRILSAVQEWQSFLQDLSTQFSETPSPPTPAQVATRWLEIVGLVQRATFHNEFWYRRSQVVLRWYLEYLGLKQNTAASISALTHQEGFESWEELSTESAESAASRLKTAVGKIIG